MPAGMERTARAQLKISQDRLAQQKRQPNPSPALVARYQYEIRHYRAVLASLGGDEAEARRIESASPTASVQEYEEEQAKARPAVEVSPRGSVEPVREQVHMTEEHDLMSWTPLEVPALGAPPSEMSPWVLGLGALVVLALLGGRR